MAKHCTGGGSSDSTLETFHDACDHVPSVARESTRRACVAVTGAQVSLDPKEVRAWLPNSSYGGHDFGLPSLDAVEEQREKLAAWIAEYSPISHVTADDPPVGLHYGGMKGTKVGEVHPDPVHSPILGIKLAETLKSHGVETAFQSSSEPNATHPSPMAFLIAHLTR